MATDISEKLMSTPVEHNAGSLDLMVHTGLFDIDGREIMIGDICTPVRGFYSQKKYKDFTAKLVWVSPALTWKWSDGYINPFPVQNAEHFRVIDAKKTKVPRVNEEPAPSYPAH